MNASRLAGAMLASLALPAGGAGPAEDARSNWFGDPYFQLTHDIAACPAPLGPFITESEALRESHHRAERGTRCHLEGRCKHPSSFDYDKEIAANIEAAQRRGALGPRPSTLWVLVQGRRVWVYGCVADGYRRGLLERRLRRIPDVELAMEELRVGARGDVPYRVR
ncbi:MAG: hypothetical protein ACXWG1_11770 [Usitatibacter sp.]